MRRDQRVFVLGEDVGVYGGAFKVTLGFQEEFGPWRVLDTPLSETAIVGGATGAALMGLRPVAEMQFADFISCAWDHLVTVAAKQFFRGRDAGADRRAPALGRRLLGRARSTRRTRRARSRTSRASRSSARRRRHDAKGLLATSIEDPNPVLYFEHKHLYRRIKGEVPEERYTIPFGQARVHRPGDDAIVVTWGAMVHTATEAADRARRGRLRGRGARPAHDHPLGQGARARERAAHVEGARPARGHAHRRLRRRDRRDDRRGGVRGPRRAA